MMKNEFTKEDIERAIKLCESMGWDINKTSCKFCKYGPSKKGCTCPVLCKDNARWTPIRKETENEET